ncbi:unnamed protein product [Trifolium pratense]|uniref:Uncharacterized protein n=1 Tax=Trifolium pratense TaxID=57577 RepID=A0ACB0L3D4_TRIPR|nr:unnamed protein product [Trifolium pratense]
MQECMLAVKKKPWYLDSGCSRHMTGDRHSFLSFEEKEGGTVTFGNNEKASIKGKGIIGKINSAKLENVHYVEGLEHNLISISQLCDSGLEVIFKTHTCEIKQISSGKTLFNGLRKKNVYIIYLDELPVESCFVSLEKDKWIWHKRAGHVNMRTIAKLSQLDLVRGLPKISFDKDKLCESCTKGKQAKSSFKPKDFISTKKPLELLHIDLFGPVKTTSLGGKNYGFVIVDDYSRYTWVLFLKNKDESFESFKIFCKKVQNERGSNIISIRSDHGGEFENSHFESFFDENGISHNFSCPRTPQQNGVVERKNRTLQEMARTMIDESNVEKYFWAEAVNTACYILNRMSIRKVLNKTPYELWKDKKPNVSYFHIFGCYCYILNIKDNLGKFDSKSDKGIFLGYSLTSKAYRVYNLTSKSLEESMHVKFDEYDDISCVREIDDEDEQSSSKEQKPANKNKMESCSSSSQKSGTKSSPSTSSKSLSTRENEIEVQSNPSNTPQTNQPSIETQSPPLTTIQISEVLIGTIPIACKTVIEPIQCSQTTAEIKTTTPKIKTNPITKKTSTSTKTKKSKSLDASKVRKSSRLASGAGRRPAIDKTVYSDDDSENTHSGSPKAKSVPEIKTYSKRSSSSKHHNKPSKSESSEEDIMIRKLKKPAPLIHEDCQQREEGKNSSTTFSLKNIGRMKFIGDIEDHTIPDPSQKRKREDFEKDSNLNLLAEVVTTQQGDHPEIILPVSAPTEQTKETVSEKTTSAQFNPFVSLEFDNLRNDFGNPQNPHTSVLDNDFSTINNPVNTSIFSPLLTSPQTSFDTTDFLKNFISTPSDFSKIHQPIYTDAGPSLPSFPQNFASMNSFCTSYPSTDSAAFQTSANIPPFDSRPIKNAL